MAGGEPGEIKQNAGRIQTLLLGHGQERPGTCRQRAKKYKGGDEEKTAHHPEAFASETNPAQPGC